MKAAIPLVSSHSTIVLLGADRQYLEENGYATYKVFYPCLLFECTFCKLSATITVETSVFITINRRNSLIEEVHSSERTGIDFSAV